VAVEESGGVRATPAASLFFSPRVEIKATLYLFNYLWRVEQRIGRGSQQLPRGFFSEEREKSWRKAVKMGEREKKKE
jgi:hypothetical protein